jgi:hypothetical protein
VKGGFQTEAEIERMLPVCSETGFSRGKLCFFVFLSQLFAVHNLVVPCCFAVQGWFPWYLKRVVLLLAGWGLIAGPASGVCQRCVFENVGSRWAALPPLSQQRANSVPALPEGRASLWILCGSGWPMRACEVWCRVFFTNPFFA